MTKKLLLSLVMLVGLTNNYINAGEKAEKALTVLRASGRVAWAGAKIGVGSVLGVMCYDALDCKGWKPNVYSQPTELAALSNFKSQTQDTYDKLDNYINTSCNTPAQATCLVVSAGLLGSGLCDLGKEVWSLAKIIHAKIQAKKKQKDPVTNSDAKEASPVVAA